MTPSITPHVIQHGEASELRQQPEPDTWWQDSAFITWHAHDAGIGGLIRIGHEPNFKGGQSALWFGVVTRDGRRFRRNTVNRLGSADLLRDGFGALDGRYSITFDGRLHLRVADEDCSAELTIDDFYPRTHFFAPDAGSLSEDFASNHFETSGRITGTVQLGGRDYAVDGLCHRDRSWGVRRWDTLLNSRWVPGTFGPELSFGSIAWHSVDGVIRRYGYVVRQGEIILAEDVDITVTMEPDGTTYRGGQSTWYLPGEAPFTIDCRALDGVLTEHHGVAVVDAVCELHHGELRGFCDLEVSTNPRGGTGAINAALLAVSQNGLSERGV